MAVEPSEPSRRLMDDLVVFCLRMEGPHQQGSRQWSLDEFHDQCIRFLNKKDRVGNRPLGRCDLFQVSALFVKMARQIQSHRVLAINLQDHPGDIGRAGFQEIDPAIPPLEWFPHDRPLGASGFLRETRQDRRHLIGRFSGGSGGFQHGSVRLETGACLVHDGESAAIVVLAPEGGYLGRLLVRHRASEVPQQSTRGKLHVCRG